MLLDEPTSSPNIGFIEFPRAAFEHSLVDRFEEQVARYPHRLAIKVGLTALSFAELNARANRIAHAILECRDGPPAPIVLLLEDTITLVTAMLGTLKAGDFYVVLDPTDPAGRVRVLVEDARAALIVCSASSHGLAAELGSGSHLLDVDELVQRGPTDDDNPGLRISPDAFVYIMYTSGSTGRPKGALQTHRNLLHAVYSTTNRPRHSADDRMGVLPPLSMGVGNVMLFSGLLIGSAVFPFSVRRHGVARMAEWLADERITSSYSLPSLIRNSFQLLPPGRKLPDLRMVKMGGEPLFRSDLPLLRDHLMPDAIVQLTLGSTETYSVVWSYVDLSSEPATAVLPLGRPDEDREVFLVDEDGQPVADGEVGQIIVRSQFLSPGYWHQPEATQAAFTVTPDGKRDYVSGDLGRILPDGQLLHLGRKDFVAKILGHLVSPNEVEMALRELDVVSDAAVVARTEGDRTRLVAYVVARDVGPVAPRELRDGLAAMLADYMIPAEYIFVERLPLLPNGKVDIARLPAAESADPLRSRPYRAPSNPVESVVADIWSDVLGRPVGVDDDFLESGGDSLLAANMLARVNSACRVELPFSALFDASTVGALANVVVEHLTRGIDDVHLAGLLDELEMMPQSEAERQVQESR